MVEYLEQTKSLWFSSKKMTVFVGVDIDNVIIETAPITRKFVEQPAINLAKWMKKQGGFKVEPLK